MNDQIPRRARIDMMTPEEFAIRNCIIKVEKLGAHPLLTDVVVLLGQARNKLADWVDLQPGHFAVGGGPCPDCEGRGQLRDDEAEAMADCPVCDGTGWKK